VTYDIDANGILNVSAADKSTGKSNQITITNEKGRLSKDEIERMVNEAEKYKADDDAQRKKVESKNSLENYCFTMKNSMQDSNIKDKIEATDQETVSKAIEEALQWLDNNQMAETDEFDAKMKELQEVCDPIMVKVHQQGGAGGMPGGDMPSGDIPEAGATDIPEVD